MQNAIANCIEQKLKKMKKPCKCIYHYKEIISCLNEFHQRIIKLELKMRAVLAVLERLYFQNEKKENEK